MAGLPDITSHSVDDTKALGGCVLRALCVAYGAPHKLQMPLGSNEERVQFLHEHVVGQEFSWTEKHLQAFIAKQRDSWNEVLQHHHEVLQGLKTQRTRNMYIYICIRMCKNISMSIYMCIYTCIYGRVSKRWTVFIWKMTTLFLLNFKGGTPLFLERPFLGPYFWYMAICR